MSNLIKIIIIGNMGVGKSCLMMRFVNDLFNEKYVYTAGIDFCLKNITLNDKKYMVQIWDTAGQERFRSITRAFYRNIDGVIFCYDMMNYESYVELEDWISEFNKYKTNKNVEQMIVGTKKDLVENNDVIDSKNAKEFANSEGFLYAETSARNNINVDIAFLKLLQNIINKRNMDDDNSIKLKPYKQKIKHQCCRNR